MWGTAVRYSGKTCNTLALRVILNLNYLHGLKINSTINTPVAAFYFFLFLLIYLFFATIKHVIHMLYSERLILQRGGSNQLHANGSCGSWHSENYDNLAGSYPPAGSNGVGQLHLAHCGQLTSTALVHVTARECFSQTRGSYHCNEAVKEASSPG